MDAHDRRAVPVAALFRLAAYDHVAVSPRRVRESQTGATVDADHGHGSDWTQTLYHAALPRTPCFSVSFTKSSDREARSGVEYRYHVCADITYVPMPRGFMYLTAVIDWYSRYVLAWQLSNSLEGTFCLEVLESALELGQPEIFNTDQGVQYTAASFTDRLAAAEIAISMDGRGRALDNVFIERLWRSVKYECLYLHGFETVPLLERGLTDYFAFYCHERPHQGLNNRTPAEVYQERKTAQGDCPKRR